MSEMRQFDTGATRDNDTGKIHYQGFLSTSALRRFGEYMEKHRVQADGKLRDPDNWKKGIPMPAYEDSMLRHVMEFYDAVEKQDYDAAEELMCAILFNAQGWLHERMKQRAATAPIVGDHFYHGA